MSVADEAKAAAEAEYPLATEASISVEASVARMRRVPFAHGYQRGYEAGVATRDETPSAQQIRESADSVRDRKHAECCGCELPGCEFMAGWLERGKLGS
ncbi:hypothetical protein SEA_TEMPO_69 [Microbacterium phage Tempo]|nr:hypothetical protein SEA_TEMPO_69 [Microbacterium phage Tempo]WNT44278.1 hypothetical protein SEA_CANDC_66 [Microbacterium phage CandC]